MATARPPLQRIVDLFAGAPKDLRLQALLEYSRKVPPLPEQLAGHRELMEQVPECQTPFFLATEVDEDERVKLHFRGPGRGADDPRLRRHPAQRAERGDGRGRPGHPQRLLHEDGPGRGHLVAPAAGHGAILARLKRQVQRQARRPGADA